jgi:hypothetical protein
MRGFFWVHDLRCTGGHSIIGVVIWLSKSNWSSESIHALSTDSVEERKR